MYAARAGRSRERAGGGNRQEFLFWFSELYVAFICRSRPVPLLLGRGWCGGAVEALFAVGDRPRFVRQEAVFYAYHRKDVATFEYVTGVLSGFTGLQ